jgi:hypothetical protein
LHLVPYNSFLAAEAFRLAGQPYDKSVLNLDGENSPTAGTEQLFGGDCTPECATYPCCLTGAVDCIGPQITCDDTDPDCHPGMPGYPECLAQGGGGPGGPPQTNACGCFVSSDRRKPAGCVQVVDTQLPPNSNINGNDVNTVGVRNVQVVWWNGWFSIRKTQTDPNGCWSIDTNEAGKAYMWVKFRSGRVKIRGVRGVRIWEYATVVSDQANFSGPPYNNIRIVYFPTDEDNSRAKTFWYAATANNALYEYDAFAAADGIVPPANNLVILLTNYEGDAAAPMLDDLKFSSLSLVYNLVTQTTLDGLAAILRLSPSGLIQFLAAVPNLASVLSVYLYIYAPDIVYNYGNEIEQPSDRAKAVFYHEFAHASHFRALNDNQYWINNITYVIGNTLAGVNPPYGNPTRPGWERCAVIEMWGEHIEEVYADRQYGLFHSNTDFPDPFFIEITRHIFQLEQFEPNDPDNPDSWIPFGAFWDLIDNNADNPAGVVDPVFDPVMGYMHNQCFTAISGSPPNVETVRNILQTTFLPPGQTQGNVTALFNEYGF